MSQTARAETTRFAPSPTGHLHLGHAYAAWFAREAGSVFRLRLEDIDPDRCKPEYAYTALQDLAWLGLRWEGDVVVQSARLPLYRLALDRLVAAGLAYPCFCSRAEVRREIIRAGAAPQAPDQSLDRAPDQPPDQAPVYPGTCRRLTPGLRAERLANGAPHAWRLDMRAALNAAPPLSFEDDGKAVACDPAGLGDVVLARRDAPASYHLCVTHDDAAQGVTLVTRGEDLRPATHLHVLLQHLLGWPVPRYRHHALLCGADGKRLAKRDGALALRQLRLGGASPEAVLRMAVLQASRRDGC